MKVVFDYRNSEKYGINAALILEKFIHLTAMNILNSQNEIDGKVWIYIEGGYKALTSKEYLPYLTERQLGIALKKLKTENCLDMTQTYNKFSSDRTYWYALNFELFENQILEKIQQLKN